MTLEDASEYTATYSSAIVTCIVLLSLGLIGNAVVLATNLAEVRRLPDDVVPFRVGMKQVGIGLPCIANITLGIFAVAWLPYVAIAGTAYLHNLGPACVIVSAVFVWSGVLYLLGLLTMAIDRVLAVRRLRLHIPEDDRHRSLELKARAIWLAIVGFWLYATTVCVVLSVSGRRRNAMSMLCTVHVDMGYFWATIIAGYVGPFSVIVACISAAAAMACTQLPEDDSQVVEESVEAALQKQVGLLRFLTVLVFCWAVGNVPVVYFLRMSATRDVETVLVLTMVCHQLVLPVTTFLRRRRVWQQLGRVWRVLRRRQRRPVCDSGITYGGEPATSGQSGDIELIASTSSDEGQPQLPSGSGDDLDSKDTRAVVVGNVVQYHRQSWEDSDQESSEELSPVPVIDLSFSSKDCGIHQPINAELTTRTASPRDNKARPRLGSCKALDRSTSTRVPMDHTGTGDHGGGGTGFGDAGHTDDGDVTRWNGEAEVSTIDNGPTAFCDRFPVANNPASFRQENFDSDSD